MFVDKYILRSIITFKIKIIIFCRYTIKFLFNFKIFCFIWSKIRHTYPTMMKLGTVVPYLRKIQKMYKSRDTFLEFCWHQHFFTGNQQILLHQEIDIWIGFWCIISNFFNFSWFFSNCFNEHGYNFDDVSKNNYSRPY